MTYVYDQAAADWYEGRQTQTEVLSIYFEEHQFFSCDESKRYHVCVLQGAIAGVEFAPNASRRGGFGVVDTATGRMVVKVVDDFMYDVQTDELASIIAATLNRDNSPLGHSTNTGRYRLVTEFCSSAKCNQMTVFDMDSPSSPDGYPICWTAVDVQNASSMREAKAILGKVAASLEVRPIDWERIREDQTGPCHNPFCTCDYGSPF